MVYLLKSAEFRKLENGEIEFFFSLKIGYTEDENNTIQTNKRLYTYFVSNRSIELLHTIPFGTKELESELHKRFKEFRWDNSNEWYIYDQSIVDYVCNIKLPTFSNDKLDWAKLDKVLDILRKFITYDFADLKYYQDYIGKIYNCIGDSIYDETSVLEYLIEESKSDIFLEKKDLKNYLDYKKGNCLINSESDKKIRDFIDKINKIPNYNTKINIINENKDRLRPKELKVASCCFNYDLYDYINTDGVLAIKIMGEFSILDVYNEVK